jgi:aminodeoxyfutalosine deaminase
MIIVQAHTVLSPESSGDYNAIAIDGAVIAACGEYETLSQQYPQAEVLDVRDCVVLPGLVNAHSHLELSDLQDRVPFEGDFVEWIGGITQGRRELKTDLEDTVTKACHQSLAGGVTCVGDICFKHRAWRYLKEQPIRKTCYAEVFGITRDLESPQAYLETCIAETEEDDLLRLGLSPHAPYSVQPKLYELAARLARKHKLPLVTHMAETEEELEFLAQGSGPWLKYLNTIHNWDGSFVIPNQRPVEYFLGMNFTAYDTTWVVNPPDKDTAWFLLAHVNYISDAELKTLAKTKHSVVYCPRAHRFFRHRAHRFRGMLQAGINVCLGTDSLASNSSLSILDEMRFLRGKFPKMQPETILAMATVNGAKAIGWADKIGVIRKGMEADLVAIPREDLNKNPLVDMLESEQPVKLTMVRGKIVYHRKA